MIEAGAGVVLVLGALAWSRLAAARQGSADSPKLLPGLALVLGVSLIVWGVTGG